MLGLSILAAGAQRGPKVNLTAMARQVEDLDAGWLTIGTWLASHPPLSARMIALEEVLKPAGYTGQRGMLRALGLIGAVYVLPMFLGVLAMMFIASRVPNNPPMGLEDYQMPPAHDQPYRSPDE